MKAPTDAVLGCYGTTATLVRVDARLTPLVSHDACTSAGCTSGEIRKEVLDLEGHERAREAGAKIVWPPSRSVKRSTAARVVWSSVWQRRS